MTSTEIALLLNSTSEKITRIGEIIGKKIDKRDNFNDINKFEKTFIYIDIFENHATEGGFKNFFWNSAGQFAHEILEAYETIGATNTATIIYNSFLLFEEIPIPKNIDARRTIITKLKPETWDNLDKEFYNNKDNIMLLVIEFVKKNNVFFD
tara:strand:+ start:1173 stop:1628 length:456 start_codon:yes stop_codon:yes gene_type:complete